MLRDLYPLHHGFSTPSVPYTLSLLLAQAIGCGFFFSLAILADGSVAVWGSTPFGPATVPAALQRGSNRTAASLFTFAASSAALALLDDGGLVSWAVHFSTDSPSVAPASGTPSELGLPGAATSAALGYSHALAVRADGSLVAWGTVSGGGGVPAGLAAPGGAGGDVAALAAGAGSSFVILRNGTTVAFGDGASTIPPDASSGLVSISAGCECVYTGNPYMLAVHRAAQ